MRYLYGLLLVCAHISSAAPLLCPAGQSPVGDLILAGATVTITQADEQIHFRLQAKTEKTAWVVFRQSGGSAFEFIGADASVSFDVPGAYTVQAVIEDDSGLCLLPPPRVVQFSINDSPSNLPTAFSSDGVRVALIDSGINAHAQFLTERHARLLQGWDWANSDGDAADDNGHGTAVASILTGAHVPIQILPLKILDANRTGQAAHIASAIAHALDRDAQILVLALEGDPQSLLDAIHVNLSQIERRGALVFLSAGNRRADWSRWKEHPVLSSPNFALVGATDGPTLANYSGFGAREVRVLAPGRIRVAAHWPRDAKLQITAQGTSYAMPYLVARFLDYLVREQSEPSFSSFTRFEQTLPRAASLTEASLEGRYVP